MFALRNYVAAAVLLTGTAVAASVAGGVVASKAAVWGVGLPYFLCNPMLATSRLTRFFVSRGASTTQKDKSISKTTKLF
jgi:hypothetical protein